MNRADRLRKLIPGATDSLIANLAAKPTADVDVIAAALRLARRDAVAQEKARRAQRRRDARNHRWYDESELADRNLRVLDATGKRATSDLAALESLDQLIRHADRLRCLAVVDLHSQGYSDEEIALTLRITRQGVWKLRTRQPEFATKSSAGAG